MIHGFACTPQSCCSTRFPNVLHFCSRVLQLKSTIEKILNVRAFTLMPIFFAYWCDCWPWRPVPVLGAGAAPCRGATLSGSASRSAATILRIFVIAITARAPARDSRITCRCDRPLSGRDAARAFGVIFEPESAEENRHQRRGTGQYILLPPWCWRSLHCAQASGADRRRVCPATGDIPALA